MKKVCEVLEKNKKGVTFLVTPIMKQIVEILITQRMLQQGKPLLLPS
jgi:hypothetical protein